MPVGSIVAELRVFSPSYTKAADRCQIRTVFERGMKLSPAYADNALYARITGTSFHAGAAVLHRAKRDHQPLDIPAALTVLKETYDAQFAAYTKAGGHTSVDTVQTNLLTAGNTLKKYAVDKQSPLLAWQSITDVELTLPDAGPCRLDVVGNNALGIPAISDLKYKRELKNELEGKTFNQFRGEWAMSHYATFLPLYRPDGPKEYETTITLVAAGPRYRTLEWAIPVIRPVEFINSAQSKWKRLESTYNDPVSTLEMPASHEDQFGICPFLRTCLDLNRDPSQDHTTPFIRVEWPRFEEE